VPGERDNNAFDGCQCFAWSVIFVTVSASPFCNDEIIAMVLF
jgi:hypothetical protein